MKRLLILLMVLAFLPAFSMAQDKETKKVMLFPFKITGKDGKVTYANEMAMLLGNELSREGDLDLIPGTAFVSAVQAAKVDAERLERIAQRMDLSAMIWGKVTQIDDGYALEISATGDEPKKKIRNFSTVAANMEEMISQLRELSVEVGREVLKRPVIGAIKIDGNKRIQKDAMLNRLEMKIGAPFRRSAVGDEIRRLYSMGYFDDVQVKAEKSGPAEIELQIVVKERPSLKEIQIEGNKLFSQDQILDRLTTKSFSVASVEKIRDDISKIKELYEKKGYYSPTVDYEIKQLSRNEAKLIFKINEGAKSYLMRVVLDGRKELSESELKKILTIKEKTWFWLIDDSGTFARDDLEENRIRLIAYYLNNGFINVQVGAPTTDIHDGKVTVTYPIREGKRFQIRKVGIDGDLIKPADKMVEMLASQPKTWFNREIIAQDIKAITRLYNNAGYAYADVKPVQVPNDKHNFVDLTYNVSKGDRVTIGKVDVKGNERTRGKVIRRSLAVGEGDLYSADRLEASKKHLEAMDFFEAVRIKTAPGAKADLMDLEVEVLEKKTGSLAAGLGYSSQDGAMGNINLSERNLFGLGVVANLKGSLSSRRNNYEGSLTYPWIFDIPLSSTVNGYKHQQKEERYFRESDGMGLNFGYPIYGDWGLSAGLSRDSSKLSGFEKVFARSIVDYYERYGTRAEKFSNISENAVSVGLSRDTRRGNPIPNGGAKISFGSRFSGFGGDVAFTRLNSEATYYQSLVWRLILKARANGSALVEVSDQPIPFDRRSLLGGISSIRGYQFGEIGPKDRFGNIIGGDRSFFGNLECLFPIIDKLNLNGVVFVDAGNAWNAAQTSVPTDVKAAAGAGIRWLSPMGPVRIEYGWKLQPLPGEPKGAMAFAMGELF
jgi:outer membrane protein insertion porin family